MISSLPFRAFLTDGWSWFFLTVAVAIFVTLTAPALFGLNNFTQWGGMYDDHWCHAEVYERSPHENPGARYERFTAGDMGMSRVYTVPSHNRMTCLVWSRTFCGKKARGGWTVSWVEPRLQNVLYTSPQNACALELPHTEHWYFHVES